MPRDDGSVPSLFPEETQKRYLQRTSAQEGNVIWQDHIVTDPDICHGKACLRGTRIPVAVVLANLAAGVTSEELFRSYPSLTADHLQAALAYAADLAQDRVIPLPA